MKVNDIKWAKIEVSPGRYHLRNGDIWITGIDGKNYLTASDVQDLTKKHNGECCGAYDSDSGCCPYVKKQQTNNKKLAKV